jgi:hypothetical protein
MIVWLNARATQRFAGCLGVLGGGQVDLHQVLKETANRRRRCLEVRPIDDASLESVDELAA